MLQWEGVPVIFGKDCLEKGKIEILNLTFQSSLYTLNEIPGSDFEVKKNFRPLMGEI